MGVEVVPLPKISETALEQVCLNRVKPPSKHTFRAIQVSANLPFRESRKVRLVKCSSWLDELTDETKDKKCRQ